jgi:hypothetical protein
MDLGLALFTGLVWFGCFAINLDGFSSALTLTETFAGPAWGSRGAG